MFVFGVFLVRIFPHLDCIGFQFDCGKIRTRKTPNTNTFHAVSVKKIEKNRPHEKSFEITLEILDSIGDLLSHIDMLKSTIGTPWINNQLVKVCKLYMNIVFTEIALRCMTWFTHKIILALLNMSELETSNCCQTVRWREKKLFLVPIGNCKGKGCQKKNFRKLLVGIMK